MFGISVGFRTLKTKQYEYFCVSKPGGICTRRTRKLQKPRSWRSQHQILIAELSPRSTNAISSKKHTHSISLSIYLLFFFAEEIRKDQDCSVEINKQKCPPCGKFNRRNLNKFERFFLQIHGLLQEFDSTSRSSANPGGV